MIDKAEALEWAKNLTAKELVEFFYEVEPFCRFDDEWDSEEYADMEEHLVIARVVRDDVSDAKKTWALDVVAPHDEEHYLTGWGPHETLHQSGVCSRDHLLMSWAKFVVCPICGAKALLT